MLLKDAKPGFNLKDFVQTTRDAYPNKCNDIIMDRETNKKAAYIFVEGLTDKDALDPHRASNCTISPLNIPNKEGKKGVIDFIRCCETYPCGKDIGLLGIVGLVDSDFDCVLEAKPPKLPSRAIYISSGPNDLESSVLCYQGLQVLNELLPNQKNNNIWLSPNTDFPEAFDKLVHYVVAPIGALRVACANRGWGYKSLEPDKNTNLISRIWDSVNHLKSLDGDNLINLLSSEFSEREKNNIRDLIQIELVKIKRNDSPWSYVRGKDLVYSIACAVVNSPNPPRAQELRIMKLITKWFNSKVINGCELKKKITEATIGDHGNWEYLK